MLRQCYGKTGTIGKALDMTDPNPIAALIILIIATAIGLSITIVLGLAITGPPLQGGPIEKLRCGVAPPTTFRSNGED